MSVPCVSSLVSSPRLAPRLVFSFRSLVPLVVPFLVASPLAPSSRSVVRAARAPRSLVLFLVLFLILFLLSVVNSLMPMPVTHATTREIETCQKRRVDNFDE